MSAFALNVRCGNCGSLYRRGELSAGFYNAFRHRVCHSCGHHGFYDVIERWVSTARLFRPWTWFSGYWEARSETEEAHD